MIDRLIFLHGWGVHHGASYGWLPERMAAALPGIPVGHIRLGEYVSFRDEVRMGDLVRAMEAALRREPGGGGRAAVIAHSTGGAVARCWWQEYYAGSGRECPVSHIIGLAPAHFGSALAQLGKGRLSRMVRHFDGIEPGAGLLDWLELGSPEAWRAGVDWIDARGFGDGAAPVFHFSLSGQRIDRRFYDGLNPYTGEMGSDGTVRVAAANLNAARLRLVQRAPTDGQLASGRPTMLEIDAAAGGESETVPFALVPGTSHSGERMGIMRSVRRSGGEPPVVGLIRRCLAVEDAGGYRALAACFAAENEAVVAAERAEVVDGLLFEERVFPHDVCSMVVVRVRDSAGCVPEEFRIEFLGENGDPNRLPAGFLVDRQRSLLDRGTVTFFFNHDRIHGCGPVKFRDPADGRTKVFRHGLPALGEFGIRVEAEPAQGFAHYHPCVARASAELLGTIIRPHQTVLVDVVLQRIVREGTMRLSVLRKRRRIDGPEGGFRDAEAGPQIR